ncbi:MAG: hypothetical protein HZA54_05925, partial [Planctomycetes bacterium]|nr:hypothetical protein [Planctomycetota bacterium]
MLAPLEEYVVTEDSSKRPADAPPAPAASLASAAASAQRAARRRRRRRGILVLLLLGCTLYLSWPDLLGLVLERVVRDELDAWAVRLGAVVATSSTEVASERVDVEWGDALDYLTVGAGRTRAWLTRFPLGGPPAHLAHLEARDLVARLPGRSDGLPQSVLVSGRLLLENLQNADLEAVSLTFPDRRPGGVARVTARRVRLAARSGVYGPVPISGDRVTLTADDVRVEFGADGPLGASGLTIPQVEAEIDPGPWSRPRPRVISVRAWFPAASWSGGVAGPGGLTRLAMELLILNETSGGSVLPWGGSGALAVSGEGVHLRFGAGAGWSPDRLDMAGARGYWTPESDGRPASCELLDLWDGELEWPLDRLGPGCVGSGRWANLRVKPGDGAAGAAGAQVSADGVSITILPWGAEPAQADAAQAPREQGLPPDPLPTPTGAAGHGGGVGGAPWGAQRPELRVADLSVYVADAGGAEVGRAHAEALGWEPDGRLVAQGVSWEAAAAAAGALRD